MIAAAETAPIERIPLQKDEGGRNARKSERPHGGPTAVRTSAQPPHRFAARTTTPPLHGPHGRPPLRCCPKSKGAAKAAAPDSLLFAAKATFAALTPVFAHRARCRIDTPRSPG